jgi:hypothetical protein
MIALELRYWRHVLPSHGARSRSRTVMTLHFLPPAIDPYESAVEHAIATCNGDLRGALRALIIANEFLERDLERALRSPSIAHDGNTGFRHVSWVEKPAA